MEILYPNFLNNPDEYRQAEALWQDQWMKLLRSEQVQEEWRSPWINNSFADGTQCRDGNPIFSAICESRHLGIRVIQYEPSGNPRELNSWTDIFAEGESDAVKELVIACVLTPETLNVCLNLMNQWINTEEVRLSYISGYPIYAGEVLPPRASFLSLSPPRYLVTERRAELAIF